MTRVIGVRFRTAGKIYYFDPGNFEIKKGDHVIVETARGVEYGTVLSDPKDVDDSEVTKPLKAVLRMANEKDDEQEKNNRVREKEAFKICKEKIIKHGLEMKLIDAEYTFDNNKVLFYFTADGRIDFRDLVKDLASEFKTRIELRQIGVRDETKIIGGYGICGRPLCCHSYLSDFIPVSIKMAKEQNLSLNPTKISGVCGRLMCCLKNEEDVYEELNRKMPGLGDIVKTPDNLEGEVASVNILRQTVKILVDVDDEKEVHEFNVDDLVLVRKKQKHKQNQPKEKDVDEEALKALEQQEQNQNNSKDREKKQGSQDRKQNNKENRQNNSQENKQNGPQDKNQDKNADGFQGRGQDRNFEKSQERNQDRNADRSHERNAEKPQERGQEDQQNKGQNGQQDSARDAGAQNDQSVNRDNAQNADGQNNGNQNRDGGQNNGNQNRDGGQRNFDRKNKKRNFNKKNRGKNNGGQNGGNQNRDGGQNKHQNQNRREGADGKQQS